MDTQEIVLALHLLTLGFLALTIYQADRLGLDWIRRKELILSSEEIRRLHKRMWLGLAVMITTGFIMFWPMREYLLTRPQFYAKMTFVLSLVINGFVIGHLHKVASERPYENLTPRERVPLFISGILSTVSWVGAALLAFFLLPD